MVDLKATAKRHFIPVNMPEKRHFLALSDFKGVLLSKHQKYSETVLQSLVLTGSSDCG